MNKFTINVDMTGMAINFISNVICAMVHGCLPCPCTQPGDEVFGNGLHVLTACCVIRTPFLVFTQVMWPLVKMLSNHTTSHWP